MPFYKFNNELFSNLFQFFEQLIEWRIKEYFGIETNPPNWPEFVNTEFHNIFFQIEPNINELEAITISAALLPHIRASFFDETIKDHIPESGNFPQIGGAIGKEFRGFLPTGETILFLLAGNNLELRFKIQHFFSEDHFFAKKRILWLQDTPTGEPKMSGRIILSQEYIDLLTLGFISRPRFSMSFPAQLLDTKMDWGDLVLNDQTLEQVRELETWIKYGDTLLNGWGMNKRLKPGYRALFHGPPGTGKTLTATLLGKYTQKDVYKVDLSTVVSKFIGETEKNLANLFAKAENKDWILFFDEADALFGKRTNVRDAHDKYANQEVAYLLQRVEDYNGLVILASNLRSNIDDAFVRRFQSIIHFPMPTNRERMQIWEKAFPTQIKLNNNLNFIDIARSFELSGAGIMNVVQYCCLQALERGTHQVDLSIIKAGVQKEYAKEGRVI